MTPRYRQNSGVRHFEGNAPGGRLVVLDPTPGAEVDLSELSFEAIFSGVCEEVVSRVSRVSWE